VEQRYEDVLVRVQDTGEGLAADAPVTTARQPAVV
jgi:hypothetical protein